MLGKENIEKPVEYNGGAEVEQLRAEIAKLREAIATLRSEIAVVKATVGGLGDIQGDENVAPSNGFIEMDRTVPDHPVIRFLINRLSKGGSITVRGTDSEGNETVGVATQSISFVSGEDSKVSFVVDDDGDGNVTVKVDVYWV